jgi:hypothetical protein
MPDHGVSSDTEQATDRKERLNKSQQFGNFVTEVLRSLFDEQATNFRFPRLSTDDVVCKRLNRTAYKLQLVQRSQENVLPRHYAYAVDILFRIDEGTGYLFKVFFSGATTFHIPVKVNRRNWRIWGSKILMLFGSVNMLPLN